MEKARVIYREQQTNEDAEVSKQVTVFLIIKTVKFTIELILWLQYMLEYSYSKLILKRLTKTRYLSFFLNFQEVQ